MKRIMFAVAALALVACSKALKSAAPTADPVPTTPVAVAPVDDGGNPGGYVRPAQITVPPLPAMPTAADLALLTARDGGNPVLGFGGGVQIEYNLHPKVTPKSGWAICADLLTHCQDITHAGPDKCVTSAPVCPSNTPWIDAEKKPCCPQICIDDFENRRRAGEDPGNAMLNALGYRIDAHSCYPGLDAMHQDLLKREAAAAAARRSDAGAK